MFKFFDVYIEFLDQNQTANINTHGSFCGNFIENYPQSDRHKIELRKIIFSEAENAILKENSSVSCYKLLKANGENA